jgi:hypothetical protein
MKEMKSFFLSVVFLFTIALLSGSGQEPTRWRGPQGNGIYPAQDLLDQWSSDGPEVIWTFTGLGEGH